MEFDDVLIEILNEFAGGKNVNVEEYCNKYPQYKELILSKLKIAEYIKSDFAEEDLSGKKLAEYIILKELGRGGMGVVLLGIHTALSRLTAIKILPPSIANDKEALKNFQEEAKIIAKFNHPNIVPIYSISNERGMYYIAMGYVPGPSLKDVLIKLQANPNADPLRLKVASIRELLITSFVEQNDISQRSISLKRELKFWDKTYLQFVLTIASEITNALSYAHQNGIIHGDIKPSNILLTNEGIPLIVDFGLSKDFKNFATPKDNEFTGTLAYAAPEQINGNITNQKTDIWALGVTLYELIILKNPFTGSTIKNTAEKIIRGNPLPLRSLNKKIPLEVEAIVNKCLEVKPENRYTSIAELSDDLRNYLDSNPIKAKPIGFIKRTGKKIRKHPVLTSLISIVFFSIIVASLFLHISRLNYLLGQGLDLQRMHKLEDAKKIYENVLRLSSRVPLTKKIREKAFLGMAETHIETQKDKALVYYNECLKINPRNVLALQEKSILYEGLGNYEEAIKCIKEALKIIPNDLFSIRQMVSLFCNHGKLDEAIKFLAEKCRVERFAKEEFIKFEVYQITDALIYTLAFTQELSNDEGYREAKKTLISKGFEEEYADTIIDKFKGLHPYFDFRPYYKFKKAYDNNELTDDDLKRFKWIINDLKTRSLL